MQPRNGLGRGVYRAQPFGHVFLGEQHDRFRVRLGHEFNAVLGQFGAQLAEVFDDAIMHNSHGPRLMRVRIGDRGRAMGRPTGVPDARLPGERFVHQQIRQVHQFADRAAAVQLARVNRRDTGAVVAAIFQTFQGFDKGRRNFVLAKDTDNTTHD